MAVALVPATFIEEVGTQLYLTVYNGLMRKTKIRTSSNTWKDW